MRQLQQNKLKFFFCAGVLLFVVSTIILLVDWTSNRFAVKPCENYDDPDRPSLGIYDYVEPDDQSLQPSYPTRIEGYPHYTDGGLYEESREYFHEYEKSACLKNLSKITDAMYRYAQDHDGRLPPPFSTDEAGTPLHSWRVLLLPYFVGEDSSLKYLYEKIRLDEPWDSEWNRQFHFQRPYVYACHGGIQKTLENESNAQVVQKKIQERGLSEKEAGLKRPGIEIETTQEMSNYYTYYSTIVGDATAFPVGTEQQADGYQVCPHFDEVGLANKVNIQIAKARHGSQDSKQKALQELKEIVKSWDDVSIDNLDQIEQKANQIIESDSKSRAHILLVVEQAQPVCWMDPNNEVTLEEVVSGQFLSDLRKFPRHIDKVKEPYVLGCSLRHWYAEKMLFNNKVTQEDLVDLVKIDKDKPDFKEHDKRLIIFR